MPDATPIVLPASLHPAQLRPRPAVPLVSIVIPVFNEEEAIPVFLRAIDTRLDVPDARIELVFVNDGSRDATLAVLLDAAGARSDLRVVNFSRNFGKEAAITAGLDHARGDAVVVMDVDLQDPPELVPAFLSRWREGYDIAYGLRQSRAGDTRLKSTTARAFYTWFNRISETGIPANAGDFRLMDRRVVDALRLLPERSRFMKGLFAWVGYPAVAVPFERPKRQAGQTKFNYWRLWNFALDGIVSFSTAPLRVWTYVGTSLAGAAALYATYIMLRVLLFGRDVPGYASIIIFVLMSTSLNLISLGMIGEYVGRLFVETKQRPLYLLEGVYARQDEVRAVAAREV